ncbi:MAG: transcriptional repressor [Thermodesulfovibrionales bacterium]|nr:transcriptional repressor [Thermodesulfovibrionales bacterium]
MIQKYKDIGLKLTPQRLAVLEYLEGNKNHPSVEEIYRAVREKYPTMSLATVYNILETLKEKGLVQELNIDPQKKRFDPDTSSHHHLICTGCGRIVDVSPEEFSDLSRMEFEGFEVTRIHVELYGLCHACREKDKFL